MACGFAMRVAAGGILSRPNTPIRHRIHSRALISLFMDFMRTTFYECWHECLAGRYGRLGKCRSLAEAVRTYRHGLSSTNGTKKESTDFNSTRKSIGACMSGGGLAPYTTHRQSSSNPPFGLLIIPYRRTAFLEWDPVVTNLHRIG